jgi:hypothetical protein
VRQVHRAYLRHLMRYCDAGDARLVDANWLPDVPSMLAGIAVDRAVAGDEVGDWLPAWLDPMVRHGAADSLLVSLPRTDQAARRSNSPSPDDQHRQRLLEPALAMLIRAAAQPQANIAGARRWLLDGP